MRGIISLVYAAAVDKFVKERERRKKILELKKEIYEINKYILRSKIPTSKKKKLSKKMVQFSSELESYSLDIIDNIKESLNTIKLGAKIVKYISKSSISNKVSKSLENIIDKIEFSEYINSDEFKYYFVSSINDFLDDNDYIIKSFKNNVINELFNEIKFKKVAYTACRNFSIAPAIYFLDNKLRKYKLKYKEIDEKNAVFYFSHGKTVRITLSEKLDLNDLDDDVVLYVVPQLNNASKELIKSYYDKENVLLVYSIEDNKFYFNRKDARAVYFVEYFKSNVPPNSEKILANVSKKRGIYTAPELGVSETVLPMDLDDFWR